MRLLLRFENHTYWSLAETELKIQKLQGFLDKNKIAYAREFGEYGAFQLEITLLDLPLLSSFLADELHMPRGCVHIPYQTLSVNGEGKFELIEYSLGGATVDRFVENVWGKKVFFPKIECTTNDA